MTKSYYMVFEVFRHNFTQISTAEVRLKDPVGARMTVLNAGTAFVYYYTVTHIIRADK